MGIYWSVGILSLLLGLGLGCLIAYSFFVEMRPEAKVRDPWPELGLTLLFIYVGVLLLGKAAQERDQQGAA